MNLLHIDAAITGEASVSRRLTAAAVTRLLAAEPSAAVTYRDLAADPLEHLTLAHMPQPGQEAPVLDEFLDADIVVIGAPMYNFTLPTQLKAWIDRILVAGRTFSYTDAGPVGLVADKRVIIAVSRGNRYGPDAAAAAAEHLETYLKAAFGFIGVDPEFVIAEGLLLGPDQRESAMAEAERAIGQLAA